MKVIIWKFNGQLWGYVLEDNLSKESKLQLIQALKDKGCKCIKIKKSSYPYPEKVRRNSLEQMLLVINELN